MSGLLKRRARKPRAFRRGPQGSLPAAGRGRPGRATCRPPQSADRSPPPSVGSLRSTGDSGLNALDHASDCVTLRPTPRNCHKPNQNRELADRPSNQSRELAEHPSNQSREFVEHPSNQSRELVEHPILSRAASIFRPWLPPIPEFPETELLDVPGPSFDTMPWRRRTGMKVLTHLAYGNSCCWVASGPTRKLLLIPWWSL